VTAYAVLLFIAGGLYALGAILGGLGALADPDTAGFGAGFALCLGLLAAIPIITAIGLWQMAKWGWWIVVILQSLGLAVIALNLCAALGAGDSAQTGPVLCYAVIGGAINGTILYWFLNNSHLFEGTGPVSASGGNAAAVIIGIVVVVVCLVPIVLIVILALLGPAIGNVFSGIVVGL
jgi:hypothetical protein